MDVAIALLIGLWVADEFSYDRWLPGVSDVYAIKNTHLENGDSGVDQSTPVPLAAVIIKDIPGVKYAVTSDWMAGIPKMSSQCSVTL